MGKRFLLGCYEVPGYGGASTAGYQLVARMRGDGIDAEYVSIVPATEAAAFDARFGPTYGNPLALPNVATFHAAQPLYGPQPALAVLIRDREPDVMLGIGYIAALLMKRARAETPLVFLTTGCQELKDAISGGRIRDLVDQQRVMQRAVGRPQVRCAEEREAVARAELIITHADVIQQLYRYFHPEHAGKIYDRVVWFSDWIYAEASRYTSLRQPFAARDVDVCFVASSWARPEKNFPLVRRIASRLGGASIHIVGETNSHVPRATHHGLVANRRDLFALLGRSKVLVSPSLFDAAPGVLFEASAMGCNIVASKNCGNWSLCNRELRVDPLTAAQCVEKISRALAGELGDQRAEFEERQSYADLIETLQVL